MEHYTKRRRVNLGIVRLNLTKHTPVPFAGWKVTSWSVHLGLWTWNSRIHRSTVDIPGVGGHVDF
ncbi:hypothetical protein [Mycobacterium intracellulare]|uniref:hypothetical protein n=1 Tax=Mycobacterium intracellulare TaxID=1767 RepID=UPI001EEF38DC|nr:hypothetical protein [Mycobacterium intracellulare]MEE3755285.1 hypothetical protein [Mycobacterium intracellulare]